MQEEQGGKGARRRECYISLCSQWHDEIHDNRLWTQCGKRSESDAQAEMKESRNAWNVAEGERRRKEGLWREGHRETRTGFKVARRNEQLEEKSARGGVCVCVCLVNVRVWVCIHMHLYTDAYSYLVARLEQTCPRTPVNIICKNKHLPIQLSASL